MGTMTIKGLGTAIKDPDLVIIRILTSTLEKVYEDSIEASNKLVNDLKNVFESIGFEKQDLKTSRYVMRPIYEDVEVGVINKRKERQLKGFRLNHDLKIEFDLDNDKINEVLKCLSDFKDDLDFEIKFSVKNKDAMKNDVIFDATKNAKSNAKILAEASGVKLGDLIKIDFTWDHFDYFSKSRYDCDMISRDYKGYIEFTPDSVVISDGVLFVWEIK